MKQTVTSVCTAILVIALCSENCFSLELTLESRDSVKDIQSYEDVLEPEILDSNDIEPKKKPQFHPALGKLFESYKVKEIDTVDEIDETSKRRVVRQAYQGQTSIYPNLPSGSPYGLEPYPSNYNNQNPSYNPQWQNSHNNNSQSGYPSQSSGYQANYKPSNTTNYNNPSGPYGQNSQPNSWQPNGNHPNYNNPYGTNTHYPYRNSTQSTFPISNGYKPNNFTNNQSQPYGQNTVPNQGPYYQSSYGQTSYNPSNGSYSSYNNSPSNPYPGYKPANTYNNSSSRPPAYSQPGQFQNNSYSSYPSRTPSPYSSNQPQYYPGQSQLNNTRYPQVISGNQNHGIYGSSTKRPGQTPYGSYNASSWAGNTYNNTQGTPQYNNQNVQNPQYSNVYPGSSPYGSYNGPNNRQPSNNSQFGQYPSNSYPGHSADSATFNLANNGYNPNIPNKPPYGSGSPYGNGPYGNSDPTKVSPGHYNSY